jgi:serine/threonine protein kinase
MAADSAFTAKFLGVTFFVKAHVDPIQDSNFPRELESRIMIGDAPHICSLLGVVVQDSPVDGTSYVQGMLLKYAKRGTLLHVLRNSDPPIEPVIKERWAAQIAHGLAGIHRAGVVHGDLKCENIVVDENDDILIIDIADGNSNTRGWHAALDDWGDPRRDVYSFAVTIWELIHDGETLPGIACALQIDWRGQNHHESFVSLVEDCHVEFADKRLSLSGVIDRLGGSDKCGCWN